MFGKKNKKNKKKKSSLVKKILAFILAGNLTFLAGIILIPTVAVILGVIGYNIIMEEKKPEDEEDDSVRLSYATPSECDCILVYDGKQFVNGYDSSILNGSGVSLNSGSTGASTGVGGAGMTNSKNECTATGEKIAELARKYVGVPYTNGAHGNDVYDNTWTQGADCSSETYYVLKEAGVLKLDTVPLSSDFRTLGKEVSSWDEMLPGDVICSSGHVCIYVGNGEVWTSGGRSASSKHYSHIGGASYYNKGDGHQYITIRRFVNDVTTVSSNNNSSGNTNVGASNGNFKTFTLTDSQILRLTRLCYAENGTNEGMRAEASLIANLYELNIGSGGKFNSTGSYNDLDVWADTCGWFGYTSYYATTQSIMDANGGTVRTKKSSRSGVPDSALTPERIALVKDVLINGHRAFPNYIDEHDSISDVKSMTVDGVAVAKSSKTMYESTQAGKVVYVKFSGSPYRIVWVGKAGSGYTDGFGYHDDVYNRLKNSNSIILPRSVDALAPALGTSDGGNISNGTYNITSSTNDTTFVIGKGIIDNQATVDDGGFSDILKEANKESNTTSNSKDLSNIVKQVNKSSTNIGSTGGLSSSSSGNTLGKYIENPDGMPLYDGYTFDSSKVEYFDLNYKQFWDGTTPQDDWLYNLGNFNEAYGTNQVTYESRDATVRRREVRNGEIIEDGRWLMASPMRILALDDPANDAYWEKSKDPSNYTKSNGNNSDPPVLGDPVKYIGYVQGVYYDVVLNDGSVLPMISGDAKAMHYGDFPRSTGNESFYRCDKSLGYAHVVAKPHQKDVFLNQCIFEVCGNGNAGGKQAANLLKGKFLKGKKVVSIRVYKNMYRKQSDGVYTDWFTNGGTDSSFGLTGGQASGNADWAGTGATTSNGSSSGNLTGTNGALKFNSDGTICINCTCEGDCTCHNGTGSGASGSSAGTSGMSGGTLTNSGKLEETPGVPQGIYYNWAENRQYTSEEVWNIFQTEAPNLFKLYSPHLGIGISNPSAALTQSEAVDVWDDKFGEWPGVIIYLQGGSPYGSLPWHVNYANGVYLDSPHCSEPFSASACGFIGCSIAISTMLHRYISPPELCLALACGKKFNTNPIGARYYLCGSYHSLEAEKSKAIFDNYVYNGKQLFDWVGTEGTFNQALVDNCLDSGGLIIGTFHKPFSAGSGHYVVITHKDANGLYYTADSNGSHNNPSSPVYYNTGHPFSYLADKQNYSNVIYVTPGPGYAEYINAIKNGAGIGSTGTLGSHIDPAGVINLSNNNAYYEYLARDNSGNIPTMSAYKEVSGATNKKNKTVFIDAACGNGVFTSYKERILPLPDSNPIWAQLSSEGSAITASSRKDDKEQANFTLDVATKLKDLLLAEGYDAVMGRATNGASCSDGGAAAIANETSDIAIRIEWTSTGSNAGVQTRYFKDGSSAASDQIKAVAKQLILNGNSSRLAMACSSNVSKQAGLDNNGAIDNYDLFLAYSTIPSVSVSCGSINTSDKDILTNKRNEIALGLKDAVNEYFK